jgi:hypothetical protein
MRKAAPNTPVFREGMQVNEVWGWVAVASLRYRDGAQDYHQGTETGAKIAAKLCADNGLAIACSVQPLGQGIAVSTYSSDTYNDKQSRTAKIGTKPSCGGGDMRLPNSRTNLPIGEEANIIPGWAVDVEGQIRVLLGFNDNSVRDPRAALNNSKIWHCA